MGAIELFVPVRSFWGAKFQKYSTVSLDRASYKKLLEFNLFLVLIAGENVW